MLATRILRFLTILAVLIMPIGMAGDSAAMAAAHGALAPAASEHCAGMDHERKKAPQPDDSAGCMLACAVIAPEVGGVAGGAAAHASLEPMALNPGVHGLHPEAATPPPRTA